MRDRAIGASYYAPVTVRRVVVTGLGAVTPLGLDAQSTWDAAVAGRSGVDWIRAFDARRPWKVWSQDSAGRVSRTFVSKLRTWSNREQAR